MPQQWSCTDLDYPGNHRYYAASNKPNLWISLMVWECLGRYWWFLVNVCNMYPYKLDCCTCQWLAFRLLHQAPDVTVQLYLHLYAEVKKEPPFLQRINCTHITRSHTHLNIRESNCLKHWDEIVERLLWGWLVCWSHLCASQAGLAPACISCCVYSCHMLNNKCLLKSTCMLVESTPHAILFASQVVNTCVLIYPIHVNIWTRGIR